MKPYFEEDGITIYHGDCREILPQLESDMVLTSPPFLDDEGATWVLGEFYSQLISFPKNVSLLIWSSNRITEIAQKYPPSRWMIWGKPFSCYTFRFNPIAVYGRGDYKPNKNIWSDYLVADLNGLATKLHPYEDPLELYTCLVKMFKDCGSILDPFMGSGTTLRAAKDLGRKAVGIEICEAYCEIAAKRLSQKVLSFTS